MHLTTWLAFFAASWAISLSPGAAAVASMTAGLNHGFRRGYVLTLGLVLGIMAQVLVVGLGLGALIAASETAFSVIKWLGVAYLIWLGIKQWRAPAVPLAAARSEAVDVTPRQLVLRGFAVNALNPKGTVFLLAVVPQFINPEAPLGMQYLVIGATLGFTDSVVMAGYTALASRVLTLLRTPRQMRLLNRIFGGFFIGVGVVLATFKRH